MLLKKLYRFNKPLFLVVSGWLFFFVFVNVKWGMVASPIYQYGMFSSVHSLKDTQFAYRIVINNEFLMPSSLSFAERDVLYVTLDRCHLAAAQNLKVVNGIRPFLPNITDTDKRFFNSVSDAEFSIWYKGKVADVTNKKIETLEVYQDCFVKTEHGIELVKVVKIPYFD